LYPSARVPTLVHQTQTKTMSKQYKRKQKPRWLADILAQKRAHGACKVCQHNVGRHLATVRSSTNMPNYKPLKTYSRKELKHELDNYTILCTWCFRIYMAFRHKGIKKRPFDSTLPCCGRLCNVSKTHHPTYQLCSKCFDHHSQLKQQLHEKVNAYKRAFLECPTCHTKIEPGNEMCFDLDHIDPYQKEHNVSHLVRRLASTQLIEKEMHKCRLVCCHCHIDHTDKQKHIFQRQDFKNHRRNLRQHGTLTNPKQGKWMPKESSSEEEEDEEVEEPKIRSTYNPLDDPPRTYKIPPL
jgi:hypothetical protein